LARREAGGGRLQRGEALLDQRDSLLDRPRLDKDPPGEPLTGEAGSAVEPPAVLHQIALPRLERQDDRVVGDQATQHRQRGVRSRVEYGQIVVAEADDDPAGGGQLEHGGNTPRAAAKPGGVRTGERPGCFGGVLLERRMDGSAVDQQRFAAARSRLGADQHHQCRGPRDSGPVGVRRQLAAAQPGEAGLRCWLRAGQHGHPGRIRVAVIGSRPEQAEPSQPSR
jgi:hypothetical protein